MKNVSHRLHEINTVRDANKTIIDCTYGGIKHRLILFIEEKKVIDVHNQRNNSVKIPQDIINKLRKIENLSRLFQ